MTPKIVLVGNPILNTPCVDVDLNVVPWQDLERLILGMTEAMNLVNGLGLAANQVGSSHRIFILKNNDLSITEYINPVLLNQTDPTQFEGEACLSVPGVSTTTTRYKEVALSWIDKHGKPNYNVFIGLEAFAVQHEMDHLNGKLYLDQFGPIKRSLLMKKHKKFLKGRK